MFHANYYERVTKREGVDGGRVTQVLSLAFKQVMWAAVETQTSLRDEGDRILRNTLLVSITSCAA